MKAQVFQGSVHEVQEELSAFLKDKNIKVSGFSQSQSTLHASATEPEGSVIITATLLYTEFVSEPKPVTGFSR